MRNIGMLAAAVSVIGIAGAVWWFTQQDVEPDVRIVDVSPSELHRDAHIPGAINVQERDVEQYFDRWSKETPIVFYCANVMCTASQEATHKAREYGFKYAYAYKGGMAEWYQLAQQYPETYSVVGPAQEAYLSMPSEVTQQMMDKDTVITAQELQKLRKTGILPNKS